MNKVREGGMEGGCVGGWEGEREGGRDRSVLGVVWIVFYLGHCKLISCFSGAIYPNFLGSSLKIQKYFT